MGIVTNNQSKLPLCLTIAEGSIDPALRIAQGKINNSAINDLCRRLRTGEFDAALDSVSTPSVCVDGRFGDPVKIGSNAAGGTFTVVMGDALTTNTYRTVSENAPQHTKNLARFLKSRGLSIGGHNGVHGTADACDCGACQKADSIVNYIYRRSDDIKIFLETYGGVYVPDQTHGSIVANAMKLETTHYIPKQNGNMVLKALDDVEPGCIDIVKDDHTEVALRVCTKEKVTLDRQKVEAVFGKEYKVFELDVPGLRKAADAIAGSTEEANNKFIAMLYYNVATAAVLAGPSLRVVVY